MWGREGGVEFRGGGRELRRELRGGKEREGSEGGRGREGGRKEGKEGGRERDGEGGKNILTVIHPPQCCTELQGHRWHCSHPRPSGRTQTRRRKPPGILTL